MNHPCELSLVIFAYNEMDNIGFVLTEVDDWAQGRDHQVEIILVDDGSSDETVSRARALSLVTSLTVVEHGVNRGIGAAIKTGTDAARGIWVTFMPADGQIDPDSLSILIEHRVKHQLDFVTSVYADRDDGLHRTVLSWGVRTLIRLFHGVTMESDGPYLFRRSDFDSQALKPDSFFLNFEFPIRILAAKKNVGVVTITCRRRMHGRSKSSGIRTIIIIGRDLIDLRLRRSRGR
jgi:glycosyltransferase involved in cell wall biosynthesis